MLLTEDGDVERPRFLFYDCEQGRCLDNSERRVTYSEAYRHSLYSYVAPADVVLAYAVMACVVGDVLRGAQALVPLARVDRRGQPDQSVPRPFEGFPVCAVPRRIFPLVPLVVDVPAVPQDAALAWEAAFDGYSGARAFM